jgi:hypothetical protein
MTTCTSRPCTCDLLSPDSASALHFDADVVHCVAASLRVVLEEQDCERPEYERLPADLAYGASLLLAEGLLEWEPPSRQAHRPEEWRHACARELKGYIVNGL